MVAAGLLAVSLVVVRSYSDLHEPRIEVPDFVPVLDRPSERDRAAADRAAADRATAERQAIDRLTADRLTVDLLAAEGVAAGRVAVDGAGPDVLDLPDRMPPPVPAALLRRPGTGRGPHRSLRSGTGAEDLADVAGDRGDG
jgi:hypothetical protein